MKSRHHQSNSQILIHSPTRGISRVAVPFMLVLILFFLLPGLLAAQEGGIQLNEQAAAAAAAAGQPGLTGESAATQTLSRELRTNRLWLLPRHAELTDLLHRAGRQALQHPDCNEVLYGSLNEFKTDRIGTSFTILCMKDARTTFNQVFFAEDLMTDDELDVVEDPADASDELERLRRMMVPFNQANEAADPAGASGETVAPVVF